LPTPWKTKKAAGSAQKYSIKLERVIKLKNKYSPASSACFPLEIKAAGGNFSCRRFKKSKDTVGADRNNAGCSSCSSGWCLKSDTKGRGIPSEIQFCLTLFARDRRSGYLGKFVCSFIAFGKRRGILYYVYTCFLSAARWIDSRRLPPFLSLSFSLFQLLLKTNLAKFYYLPLQKQSSLYYPSFK
jgi:hypothetical protein